MYLSFLQVEQDFRALFAEVCDNLYMLWTANYAEEVIKYASLQGKWQTYLHIDTSSLSKRNIHLILFYLQIVNIYNEPAPKRHEVVSDSPIEVTKLPCAKHYRGQKGLL